MDEDVERFARSFTHFAEAMQLLASQSAGSPVRDLLDEHLGVDSTRLPVVAETFASYDHVNLQVALDGYLEEEGRTHELVGLAGQQRRWMSLADLVSSASQSGIAIGSVDFVNLPIGPEATLPCVAFGVYLIEDHGVKLAVLVRQGAEDVGPRGGGISVEVVSHDREAALGLLAELRRLMVERNVFRGQVISFGESRLGYVTLGPIAFHDRPNLERDAIVLPEGLLDRIERQVFGIAEQRERLRAAGQHVKRGLLLHGPPGTGKTLTARYLAGRARDHTVIVLTGGALGMVRAASSLARMLQPSIVILEDVDLVAQHRIVSEYGNPLLFEVLNVMDGIEEDADVTFLLTTNRVDLLEPALAARPGRVDLAVAIPLPDEDARRRLLQLYAGGVELNVTDLGPVVAATAGVPASFIKELVRKAAVRAALRDGSEPLAITDPDLDHALTELLDESNAITRVLLGAGEGRPGTEWLRPDDVE